MSREFWIDIEKVEPIESTAMVHFNEHDGNTKFFETVHVIEYSAYEKSQEQLKVAEEKIKQLEASLRPKKDELAEAIEEAKAEIERLRSKEK